MPLATRRPDRPGDTLRKAALAGAGLVAQPAHVLDIPFELRGLATLHKAKWDGNAKAFIVKGELPAALEPFRSQPYSWERLKEDELNRVVPSIGKPTGSIELREHQGEFVDKVKKAIAAGRTCFLNADDVGLGKTIETWKAILEAMGDLETVLIVCPLSVVAHWRRTIALMGDGGKRIVVINYDRLKRLFEVPPEIITKSRKKKTKRKVRTAKGVARYGEPYEFDVIVWDESHRLRNLQTARSKMSLRLNACAERLLWLSATAGQQPLELAYLAPLLCEITGHRAADLKEFEEWCQAQGIGVSRGAFGKWIWRGNSEDPIERALGDEDLEIIRRLLFDGTIPGAIRRTPSDIKGWPEVNRILLPIAIEGQDRADYNKAWDEFRRALGLEMKAATKDARNALAARLRFRQKASLLRTAATADLASGLLEQGQKVGISVAFHETKDILRQALESDGYRVSVIDGTMGGPEKERQRLDFQQGRADACVYTVEEAISLHQGEYAEDDVPRSNLIHDLRWGAIPMKQIEGRTHRDGRFSQVYWMLGADTVEERIADVVSTRLRSMSMMQGDTATVEAIDEILHQLAA